ncbi:MAG TPA: TPM domain-containing protein [Caldimonas sp.]|jgi:uncharacterized membrane protein|nr:TPM domain-containing protein [Caldimonas sp.]HEX2543147.1 TPM domain-containing protein [Caldimonas sp.]
MANRITRLLRHRMFDEDDVARVLPPAALARIESRVKASEERHGGEIRIYVEAGLPWSYLRRGATPRERAIAMFGKLGVWDTERNNGVLIYLLLAEHAIEIVADRGLARHVDDAAWAAITATMRDHFRRGDFATGLEQAVDAVDALLARHFPRQAGDVDRNELPDAPLIG